MTSTSTRSTPTSADIAFPHAVDNFRNVLEAGQDLFRGWAAIHSEVTKFATQQLKQSAEAWTHTRSLDDALKAQSEIAQSAFARYFETAEKVMKIGNQAFSESYATLQKIQTANGTDASGAKAPKTAAAA